MAPWEQLRERREAVVGEHILVEPGGAGIVGERVYFDLATILGQLGLLPAPGTS